MCAEMNFDEIDKKLSKMSEGSKLSFLIQYGHELTIMARGAYLFQSDEVANPKLLRGINEIQHRLFQAIRELSEESKDRFSLESISHWIACEDRNPDVQEASIKAFSRTLHKCK